MSQIWLDSISIKNYRSFKDHVGFNFPDSSYRKPISIVGYNNSGKTNLLNAIRYGVGDIYISSNSNNFEIHDLHNLNQDNNIEIKSKVNTSFDGNFITSAKTFTEHIIYTESNGCELKTYTNTPNTSLYNTKQKCNIFYINFHKIKDELVTKKSSWGTFKSFLSKFIKKILDKDSELNDNKADYLNSISESTKTIISNSTLQSFINSVKSNYSNNLRLNNCVVEFGLPPYEDFFSQMIFKIGLNGDSENLLPIGNLGDGYVSMFVIAVIQAIAETVDDKCLFLFEEPESFLHDNHQEYFYKMVLCSLSENGHQVIYTTHSHRLIDIFDTKSIIRIEYDEIQKRTLKKYNDTNSFKSASYSGNGIEKFNSFVKCIEPNINKILFSRKIILVEGPNDLLAYNYATEKIIRLKCNDYKYAQAHLNFKNISFAVHHGKDTACIIVDLCKHFGLDYFIINDWDFDIDFQNELNQFNTHEDLKSSDLYLNEYSYIENHKSMITSNYKLLKASSPGNIHFNIPKLESVINCSHSRKKSIEIWKSMEKLDVFPTNFFPLELINFLEINDIEIKNSTK